jgi:hypothetical protein
MSHRPADIDYFFHVGAALVDPKTPPPTFGKPGAEFRGPDGGRAYRPLVLTTNGVRPDPEGWKAAQPSRATLRGVTEIFRGILRDIPRCEGETWTSTPTDRSKDQARVVSSHKSRTGAQLVSLQLASPAKCDGPDPSHDTMMFLVRSDGAGQFLGAGLQFLDAADYDGDGRSEVVFTVNTLTGSGFALLPSDTSTLIGFTWTLH